MSVATFARKRLWTTAWLIASVATGMAIAHWWWPAGSDGDEPVAAGAATEREILYWKAPMDANYRRDKPGKSPMGMDLVPVYADEASDDDSGVVTISPKIASNLGVRTAPVERGVLSRRIETIAYVAYDEDTLQQVNTRVDGWIEKLAVKASGDPVKQGQVLFELYSPTLVNAQQEFLAMLATRNPAVLDASRERLAALGLSTGDIKRLEAERTVRQRVSIVAARDGIVSHLDVREGTYVMPATRVMAIAELDRVWVLAEVFERQAAWVRAGQRAEIEFDYLPGGPRQGRVDYVYPELDAKTRTLPVRIRLDNPALVLRPNMLARVTIYGEESGPVLQVPREALIRGGSVDRVVLALGGGRYRAQPVEVGIEAGDRVEIRHGMSAGDRVVVSGQFLIDSESNIDAALARMEDSETEPSP